MSGGGRHSQADRDRAPPDSTAIDVPAIASHYGRVLAANWQAASLLSLSVRLMMFSLGSNALFHFHFDLNTENFF